MTIIEVILIILVIYLIIAVRDLRKNLRRVFEDLEVTNKFLDDKINAMRDGVLNKFNEVDEKIG